MKLPFQSKYGCSGGFGFLGRVFIPMKKAMKPKGILIMKSQCQVDIDIIHPARLGPAAVAIEINMAFNASPRPNIFLG